MFSQVHPVQAYQCMSCGHMMAQYCHSKAHDFRTRLHATTIVCENAQCPQRNQHFRKPVGSVEVSSVELLG